MLAAGTAHGATRPGAQAAAAIRLLMAHRLPSLGGPEAALGVCRSRRWRVAASRHQDRRAHGPAGTVGREAAGGPASRPRQPLGDRGPQTGRPSHRPATPLARIRACAGIDYVHRPAALIRLPRLGARRESADDRKAARPYVGPDARPLRSPRPRSRQGLRRRHWRQHRTLSDRGGITGTRDESVRHRMSPVRTVPASLDVSQLRFI